MNRIARPDRQPPPVGHGAPPLLLSALLALILLLAPAVTRAQEQAAQETASEPPQATAAEGPIPAPPRFLKDVAATIGDHAGDVFWWGQSANVTGEILNNVFLGGQTVTIDGGTVASDVFAFAQSIVIDGVVRQNVYAFGSEVRIANDAVVHGNVLAFAGSLRTEGRIRGRLLGSGGIVYLDGEIGAVEIESGNLTIAPTARILGDLEYNAKDEVTLPEGASVGGELRWNQPSPDDDEEDEATATGFSMWSFGWKAWWYLSSLIVGAAFLLLGGRGARLPADCLRRQPAPGLGFGFVVAVVFPVACLVAIALLVTLPLGMIGLVIFALTLFLARLVAAQYLGGWLLRRLSSTAPSEYLALALGLLLFQFVALIPYVGFLIRYTAVILGVGGIYLAVRAAGFPAAGVPAEDTYAAPAADPTT